jgi:hypothetical protein
LVGEVGLSQRVSGMKLTLGNVGLEDISSLVEEGRVSVPITPEAETFFQTSYKGQPSMLERQFAGREEMGLAYKEAVILSQSGLYGHLLDIPEKVSYETTLREGMGFQTKDVAERFTAAERDINEASMGKTMASFEQRYGSQTSQQAVGLYKEGSAVGYEMPSSDIDVFRVSYETPEEIATTQVKIYEAHGFEARNVEGTVELRIGGEWRKVRDIHTLLSEGVGSKEYFGHGMQTQFGKQSGVFTTIRLREQLGRKGSSTATQILEGKISERRGKDIFSFKQYEKLGPGYKYSMEKVFSHLPEGFKQEAQEAFYKGTQPVEQEFIAPYTPMLASPSIARQMAAPRALASVRLQAKEGVSQSTRLGISKGISAKPSVSMSFGRIAVSPSVSASASKSMAKSVSASFSPSASKSISASMASASASFSPSPSMSLSMAPSISPSISTSVSPSISPSMSLTLSPSISPSVSPSISPSVSYKISPTIGPPIPPIGIGGFGGGKGKKKQLKGFEFKHNLRDIGLNLVSAMNVQARTGKLQVTAPTVRRMTEKQARKYEIWGGPAQEELDMFRKTFKRGKLR